MYYNVGEDVNAVDNVEEDIDDDDDDDDENERKIMMWMLRRRRRKKKMMVLRRVMLRRKTDPKTGKHTLCEPAQSKFTRTFHKSHCVWKLTGKMPDAKPATPALWEPAQSKCMSEEAFCAEICGENAGRFSRGQRFVRACAVEMHMDMSQEAFCVEIDGKCQMPRIPPRSNTGP